jgi:hypothetical protein
MRRCAPIPFARGARRVEAAGAAFTAAATTYPAGSLVLPLAPGEAAADVRAAAERFGIAWAGEAPYLYR